MTSDATPQPPAPRGDEIDPELVALRRPRAGIGPLLAVAVLSLIAYLMVRERADLAYALHPRAVRDLGDATELYARGGVAAFPDNTFVSLRAQIDLTAPTRLRGQQDTGRRLVAVRGTAARVWVDVEGESRNVAPVYDLTYVGRLRRAADLPFTDDARAFLARSAPAPRVVFPEGLAHGRPSVDVAGDPLAPPEDARVALEERDAALARVTIVRTDSIADEPAARAALVRAGLVPGSPVVQGKDSWVYEVSLPSPGDVAAVSAALRAARLFSAQAEPKLVRTEGTWKQLEVADGHVALPGRQVPLASLERLIVYLQPQIPADAVVLVDGDAPGALWYVPFVYGFLSLVALFLVWALFRRIVPARK